MSLTIEEFSAKSPSNRKSLLEDEEVVLSKQGRCGVNNLCVLYVTAFLFGGFVVAELIGALAGHSLSLLGDAAAMAVDVFTYFSNMYAESVKAKQGFLDGRTRYLLEVYIPSFSVMALLGVTIYIMTDAVQVIRNHGDDGEEVSVVFLYAFSCGNFAVDVFSSLMFYLRGADGLKNYHTVVHITHGPDSLDSSSHHPLDPEQGGAAARAGAATGPHDHYVPPLRAHSLDERTERFIHDSETTLHAHQQEKMNRHGASATAAPVAAPAAAKAGTNNGSSYQHGETPSRSMSMTAVRKIRNNLNMLSALTHVGSDTMRTLSVFIAAVIASTTGYSGNLCDAWAAVVVSITIFGAVIPLCAEIYKAATHPLDDMGREIMPIGDSSATGAAVRNPMGM